MTWTDLTFVGCSVLTSDQMTRLQQNFPALAQGAPGAPVISRAGGLTVTSGPPALPASHTVYAHPAAGAVGHAVPLDPTSALQPLAGALTQSQGGLGAGSLETWHEIGAAGEPPFQNGWVNYDSTYYSRLRFIKLATGLVLVRGMIKDGSIGDPVFSLPAGYRPLRTETFPAIALDVAAKLEIFPNGSVTALTGSNIWFAVGAVFLAEG